jgi:hypothetical protein
MEVNPGELLERTYSWMRSRRLDRGSPVTVDAAAQGIRIVPTPRHVVQGVLETLVQTGALSCSDGKYKLTEEGEGILYPGTVAEHIDNAAADLKNYMLTLRPIRVFKLQEYKAELRQRLNPREEAALGSAMERLVEEGYWGPTSRDTYILIDG